MTPLSDLYIQENLADSPLIFDRGKQTFENGSYFLSERNTESGWFIYAFDGAFGHYTTRIRFLDKGIEAQCTCPYPGTGCRHAVAAALNARDILVKPSQEAQLFPDEDHPYLSSAQIREQALRDREERAKSDRFTPIRGDMFTGDHKVVSKENRTYTVCLHDPAGARGHCSCPDYLTNGLGTCKHIIFMADYLSKEPGFDTQAATERLPFIDIFWDSLAQAPRLFAAPLNGGPTDLRPVLDKYFNKKGDFIAQDISLVMGLMLRLRGDRRVRIRDNLLKRVDHRLQALQLEKMAGRPLPKIKINRPLYPFQERGVDFGVLKTGVLIGDEMGLGKTCQAIALGLLKTEVFGFSKILVITLASRRHQWKEEVSQISGTTARVIQGTPARRRNQYLEKELFKIIHYETVIRDVAAISGFNPDIIILDEAQRIRNISAKTAEAVKRLPKKHGIVLTGTPLENKPEDLYSIVQFLDPYKFTPLWRFASDHFLIPKAAKTAIAGYKNLDRLGDRLKDILIRRTYEEVSDQLPPLVTNTYLIDLAPEQCRSHRAYAARLGELLAKKIPTDMDMEQIQTQVMRMRMVANSTFLVDRETQVSPKLRELATIVDEVVAQNRKKLVIFSEWTAMTFLIARRLSEAGIGFAQASAKLDQKRRRDLAGQFSRDPDCLVFLTTDAGSLGLDLSAARCMVNVEPPWTPAQAQARQSRLIPERIRKDRAGIHDPPGCHVINLVGAQSIEEAILKGLNQDPDLFTALFGQGGPDTGDTGQKGRQLALGLKALLAPGILPQGQDGPGVIPDPPSDVLFPEGAPFPDTAPGPAGETWGADPEKLEAVLNSGFDFMAGLLEMATGQPLPDKSRKQITVDPDTGKVSFSFHLPGRPK